MTYAFFGSFSSSNPSVGGTLLAALLLAAGCGGSSSDDAAGGGAGEGGSAGTSASGGNGNTGGDAGTAGIGAGGSGGVAGGGVGGGAGATGGSAGAGAGGAAGASTGGIGGAACVEQMGSGGFSQPECSDLDRLVLQSPRLDPPGGISAGSKGTFRVDLTDVSGYGFNFYPGVDFESDTQGVTVTDEQFFAVLPCGTNETTSNVEVDSSVAPGTEVTITATVMMLNAQCTGTDSVSYKFTVPAP